jgi:hypothetical protein
LLGMRSSLWITRNIVKDVCRDTIMKENKSLVKYSSLFKEISRQSKRRNKYGARRIEVNGISFQSVKEGKRYKDLLLLELAGVVRDIKLQKTYRLHFNGVNICDYRADFCYDERKDDGQWISVVEDVKGYRKGDAYKRFLTKKKLMKAVYGLDVIET